MLKDGLFLQVIKIDIDFISYPCDRGNNLKIVGKNNYVHIDNLCGTMKPDSFTSFSNFLRVTFTAAHSTKRQTGFLLTYSISKLITVSAHCGICFATCHLIVLTCADINLLVFYDISKNRELLDGSVLIY